jgi:flavin reductase (DIM6/NTAB) family NADH-FMN oxidoreductase RutF
MAGELDRPPEEFRLPLRGGFVSGAPEAIGESYLDELPAEPPLRVAGEGVDADTALAFRRTLGMFATGVTIVTALAREQVHGMTANAFMSVSLEPPLVLISVDRRARMNALLHEGSRYGISVLAAEQEALSDHFAGRPRPDPPQPRFELVNETPLVEGAIAHLVARVVRSYWGGDHSLFLGRVEYARHRPGRPLLFHGGRYERLGEEAAAARAAAPELLRAILAGAEERQYADGEAIVRAGEIGEELFVLLSGTARAERGGVVLRTLGAGELLGELAALDGRARSADVVASGPVRCAAIGREALRAALAAAPEAAWALLRHLAARARGA